MTIPESLNAGHASLLWAGPEFATEVSEIHATLFKPAWDHQAVLSLLQHPGSTALVARHGFPKQTIGFVMAQIAGDEAEVLSIGVAQSWQRQGLGKRLVEGIDRALQRAGVAKIFLEVADDNVAGRALYEHSGFAEVGRRAGYYERANGPAVDALQLAKSF